jgi:ABC transporter transmembrane region 2
MMMEAMTEKRMRHKQVGGKRHNTIGSMRDSNSSVETQHGTGGGSGGGGGSDYVSFAVEDDCMPRTNGEAAAAVSSSSSPNKNIDRRRAAYSGAADATTDTCKREEQELFEDEYHYSSSSSSPAPFLWPSCWNRKGTFCWHTDFALSRLLCCLVVPPTSATTHPPRQTTSSRCNKWTTNGGGNASSSDGKRPTGSIGDWKSVRRQVQLFFQMACPYYRESRTGRCLLCILLVLTVLNAGLSALFSFLSRDFWNALSDRNVDDFSAVLFKYILALTFGAPFIALYKFQQEQLAVHWREWLTFRTLQLYTQNRIYYKLERGGNNDSTTNATTTTTSSGTENHDHKMIDNPDQRISQDIESFTSFSLSLLVTLLISFLDLVVFSVILWSIYPTLFIAIITYAVVGTCITTILGHVLIRLQFQQLQNEANLRYALVRCVLM